MTFLVHGRCKDTSPFQNVSDFQTTIPFAESSRLPACRFETPYTLFEPYQYSSQKCDRDRDQNENHHERGPPLVDALEEVVQSQSNENK